MGRHFLDFAARSQRNSSQSEAPNNFPGRSCVNVGSKHRSGFSIGDLSVGGAKPASETASSRFGRLLHAEPARILPARFQRLLLFLLHCTRPLLKSSRPIPGIPCGRPIGQPAKYNSSFYKRRGHHISHPRYSGSSCETIRDNY
jgi:hypothetical protein